MPYRQNGASQDRRGALVPDASIVITTYRRTAMLAELLGALRPQLRDHAVEVIIVDNCPDASARKVVRGEGDAALRYVHEKRSGVVHARNTGVAAASGAYVIFLDDDEVPCIGWLDAWMTHDTRLALIDSDGDTRFPAIINGTFQIGKDRRRTPTCIEAFSRAILIEGEDGRFVCRDGRKPAVLKYNGRKVRAYRLDPVIAAKLGIPAQGTR